MRTMTAFQTMKILTMTTTASQTQQKTQMVTAFPTLLTMMTIMMVFQMIKKVSSHVPKQKGLLVYFPFFVKDADGDGVPDAQDTDDDNDGIPDDQEGKKV